MKFKKEYLYVAGVGISLLVSAGSAVYTHFVGKKFKDAIDTIADYNEEVETAVDEAVDEVYDEIKDDVKKELTRQILNLDISEVKNEIIKEASEKVREKLEDYAETSVHKAAFEKLKADDAQKLIEKIYKVDTVKE